MVERLARKWAEWALPDGSNYPMRTTEDHARWWLEAIAEDDDFCEILAMSTPSRIRQVLREEATR